MPLFVKARTFLRNLFATRRVEADLDQEVQSHLAMLAEENVRAGMSPEEARRAAHIELGGIEQLKEQVRGERIGNWFHSAFSDCRFAVRQLRKSPGFTAVAVLSLALGSGASTAVFSVIYAVVMHPYPYAGADRMFRVAIEDQAGVSNFVFLTGSQLTQLQQAKSVEGALGEWDWELATTGADLPEDVRAVFQTSNATSFFGVRPLLGRGLLPSDAPDGSDPQPIVVLSYAFWRRHFAGEPDVLGKTLELAHKNYTVVGVMPPRFAWIMADVYLPLKVTNDPQKTFNPSCVKLRKGVTPAAAEAELQPLFEEFAKETPEHFPETFRIHMQPLTKDLGDSFGRFEHSLFLLTGAVGVLLLIGCGNVSILLLARGIARQHELAIRTAVGATRKRIIRQLLSESLLLALAGTALGIMLAYGAVGLIVKWLPIYSYPPEVSIQVNLPVLMFSVALALLTVLVFGISPSLRLSRPEVSRLMQATSRTIGGGVGARRMHTALIAGQIALTLLLLSGAGAAMQGLLRLMHTKLGYDPHNTMSVGIPLHENTYMTWEARAAYFNQLRQQVAAIPGVVSAAISTLATPPANGINERMEVMRRPAVGEQRIRLNLVSLEYFPLLKIPVLQGRIWDQAETTRGARLAVINETMARQYWPNGDALGNSFRMPEVKNEPFGIAVPDSDQWFQIVGVVGDAKNDSLANPVKPAVYVPYTIWLEVYTHILVHAQWAPLALLRTVRERIRSVDPDQQVEGQGGVTLEGLIDQQQDWQQSRLVTTLFSSFGALALLLAIVGLYSVVSYSVAQRTAEFGIRMALGAQRLDLMRAVFASATASITVGLVTGVLLTLTFTKLLASWSEGSTGNPLVLLGITLLLICCSVAACFLPARRASRVDPMIALRYE
jgi:predicted permease